MMKEENLVESEVFFVGIVGKMGKRRLINVPSKQQGFVWGSKVKVVLLKEK